VSLLDRQALRRALDEADPTPLTGTVVRATGLIVEATLRLGR
jgi:flagellum-specific ATP synthase